MNSCTFFGHHSITKEITSTLLSTLIDLIENHDVKLFYVGNHGAFDSIVQKTLFELSEKYAISFYVVLAYVPGKKSEPYCQIEYETILPEGIENVPRRFAIIYRNKWMINRSDYVVTYVSNEIGSGAARFKRLAEQKHKSIIELCSDI